MADSLSDAVLVADPEPVAHARRRYSAGGAAHKPQANLPNANELAQPTDPDTCRICRGEATREEPLFFPCKCSGSIKYVHQDCLLEWLSHSQKKHCELCKTSFRFTKLYDRNMPKTLPFFLFVTRIAKYLLDNILVWLRAALVISMWLIWLPYLMRSIWSLMFWISDEGFGGGPLVFGGGRGEVLPDPAGSASLSGIGQTVCPASPLLAASTTVATVGGVVGQVPSSTAGYGMNLTSREHFLYAGFLHLIFGSAGSAGGRAAPSAVTGLQSNGSNVAPLILIHPHWPVVHHSSLFSDVPWLNNLTKRPMINKNVIYVLEGQVITVLVIVCFILIILVRDYVVLQQPEINARAAFAAAENLAGAENQAPAAVQEPENPTAGLRAEDIEALRGPDPPEPEAEDDSLDSARAQGGSEVVEEHDADIAEGLAPSVHLYRRLPFAPTEDFGEGSSSVEHSRPARNRESGHRLDEISHQTLIHPPSGLEGMALRLDEFLPIFREAGGDQEKILKIVRERRLEDRLGYWLRLTEAMTERARLEQSVAGDAAEKQASPAGGGGTGHAKSVAGRSVASRDSDKPSEWTFPVDSQNGDCPSADSKGKENSMQEEPRDPLQEREVIHPSNKGKEKVVEDSLPLPILPTRQRAVSDGPQPPEGVHPLANNSWSFPKLESYPLPPSHDEAATRPRTLVRPLFDGDKPASGNTGRYQEVVTTALPRSNEGPPASEVDSDRDLNGEQDNKQDEDQSQAGAFEIAHPDEGIVAAAAWQDPLGVNEGPLERLGGNHGVDARPLRQPNGFADRLADFMWRGIDGGVGMGRGANPQRDMGDAFVDRGFDIDEGLDDDDDDDDDDDSDEDNDNEHGVDDNERRDVGAALERLERDPEVVEAAVAAGLDPDAIDDAEDFEGVMELLGMRGPVAGLFQNAIFCAFLVSVTVFTGIFVPYNIGRVGVWILANPMLPVRITFGLVKLVQDFAIFLVGAASWAFLRVAGLLNPILRFDDFATSYVNPAVTASFNLCTDAALRIADGFTVEPPIISTNEIRNFSAVSHEALLSVKWNVQYIVELIGEAVVFIFGGNYSAKGVDTVSFVSNATSTIWDGLKEVPAVIADPSSWVISLSPSETAVSINPELAYWDGTDRFWAVVGGYLTLCLLAALYLHRGRPFSTSQAGQDREASIIDGLNQASGVMKVILIIGIEMLIFPLYCGLLLDIALLPLFENTTLKSRILFTYNYPLTSIFVHWFVGTGYMFHFALFVSMCRKIMRKGVLYFIRDPDDPEFHPVRDVLERNVTTQLRKILFSAFVYGALVIICLGGVVWGLWVSLPNVLPIHYSSNEPVLEFPADLLFYNFLMPLAVKFFKPGDGLHAMYTWWFRKCARALRVTWFLFGERRIDEEGVLVLAQDPKHRKLPFWRRLFLEVDAEGEVAPKTWDDVFDGGESEPSMQITPDQMSKLSDMKLVLVNSGQIIPDGRFVRTPASDQVKIPKGKRVFLDVSEANVRTEVVTEQTDLEIYSTSQYQLVYIPPHFKLRVFLFILFIWVFAAVTGVGFTIIPLIFGRRIFQMLIPNDIRTNDIYAFSIGVYILGSFAYCLFHIRQLYTAAKGFVADLANDFLADFAKSAKEHAAAKKAAAKKAAEILMRAARVVYSYFFLLVVFPLLVSSLMELYWLIPLNTYMFSGLFSGTGLLANGTIGNNNGAVDDGSRHTVRVMQAWTLGLLYMKFAVRIVTSWYEGTRLAAAIEAVLQHGWLDPNVGVLTRAFVIPSLAASAMAILGPLAAARLFLAYHYQSGTTGSMTNPILIYRLSFPTAAASAVLILAAWATLGVFRTWKVRIRDENWLIGERLHNFTASSHRTAGAGASTSVRARVAWREDGVRI